MLQLLRIRIILISIVLLVEMVLSCPFVQSRLALIEDKMTMKEIPIFEFKKNIEECIIHNNEDNKNIYELETLYNRYIDCLRDHYLQIFTDNMKNKGPNIDEMDFTDMKLHIVKECKAAMASAIPSNNDNNWNYDGTLLELINDIDQLKNEYFVSLFIFITIIIISIAIIKGMNQIDNTENKKMSKLSSRNLFKKRLKWVFSRCAIFGINYSQMILVCYIQ